MSQKLPPEEIVRLALQDSASRLRRQHELAVELGVFTLRNAPTMDVIFQEACRTVALGVGSRFAKVLQYQTERDEFLLINGVGWAQDDIGSVSMVPM